MFKLWLVYTVCIHVHTYTNTYVRTDYMYIYNVHVYYLCDKLAMSTHTVKPETLAFGFGVVKLRVLYTIIEWLLKSV